MINRRKLVVACGAGGLAAPFMVRAQPAKAPVVVGILGVQDRASAEPLINAFRQGLLKLGHVEGKGLTLQMRFADGKFERVAGLASELVKLKPDVILSVGGVTTAALQKATGTIPIVMGTVADPVKAGFVKTLARPGGNITGLSTLGAEIGTKHLEMLLGMVPKLARVAVLLNSNNPSGTEVLSNIQSVARRTSATIIPVEAPTATDIEKAFAVMVREKAGAVIVARDGLFVGQWRQIAQLALKNRLPSIADPADFAEAGGLISYGVSVVELFRRAATYMDKILKGAKPGDLPVEQPTRFELVINGKTAKALGLSIPPSLQVSVDRVIE